MSTILDKIIAHKRKEVEKLKTEIPVKDLERQDEFSRTCFSLKENIRNTQKTGVIAEFKRKSPSKDDINLEASVQEVTQSYTQNGASGLSVLTDQDFFGGRNEDLKTARRHNTIPILRKDFIVDDYQIFEAKAIGADVILLITECLNKSEITKFTERAESLGMEVLLEMHSEKQLDKIGSENTIVGINNRDLTTFKVDIDRSIALSDKLPKTMVRIAESGINNAEVIKKMRAAGFDGFLMGEHFMKNDNPGRAFKEFVREID